MNEIERILKETITEIEKNYSQISGDDTVAIIIEAGLIKAAYSAIIDGNVAISITKFVENSENFKK